MKEVANKAILLEVEKGLATVTLNRPGAANAMNLEFMQEIHAVASECSNDPDIRAVLLTGAGKMFSVGGDLGWFGQHMDEIQALLMEATFHLHGAITRLAKMDKPLVVAVNGAAAGAGFSLAILGDYTVAAESASFTMAYTAAGLSPDGGSSYRLPRLIGEARARELMLTNRKLSATEALDWGMINAVVPDEELQAAARKMAQRLAAGPTGAYGAVKQLLNASAHNTLESQLDLEARTIAGSGAGADGREGIEAFLARRKPQFTGR